MTKPMTLNYETEAGETGTITVDVRCVPETGKPSILAGTAVVREIRGLRRAGIKVVRAHLKEIGA